MSSQLKNVFWDYNFTDQELNDLLYGRIQRLGGLTRAELLSRMLRYMNWFDIVQHINKDIFLENFTPEFINQLPEQDLQQGLVFVRNFLRRETISAAR